MTTIASVTAFEILDSRGNPTIKTIVTDDAGHSGWASVPSGASTGTYEAVELRDGGKRFLGRGVTTAISHVKERIAPAIMGKSATDIKKIDEIILSLDHSENKKDIGANAMLGVSLACARLAAAASNQELFVFLHEYYFSKRTMVLPLPLANLLNGGRHANNSVDLQEFMVIPLTSKTFAESYRMVAEIYQTLKNIIAKKELLTTVGDEGGFAPQFSQNTEALDILVEAITQAGYTPGTDIGLAIDAAASELLDKDRYILASEGRSFGKQEFIDYFTMLARRYPIISLEDPLAEDDWEGFVMLMQKLGDTFQIVGDDLYVTNLKRLEHGITQKASNSIIIKPNQIGTLSETVAAITMSHDASYTAIISHRSGETEDPFIADLAVACGCGQIKSGAPARGERTAKYNRLVEIETFHPDIPIASFPYHVQPIKAH